MTEAVFGLIGVLIGSAAIWVKDHWTEKKVEIKNARYLAIHVVCILSKYVDDCVQVVCDDGLCEGQTNKNGEREVQVKTPYHPTYPEDIDWKSIDPQLMYSLLFLPSEAKEVDYKIAAYSEHSFPPDYEEFFEERQYQYAILGLKALDLTESIRAKYGISQYVSKDFNRRDFFMKKIEAIDKIRAVREERNEASWEAFELLQKDDV